MNVFEIIYLTQSTSIPSDILEVFSIDFILFIEFK